MACQPSLMSLKAASAAVAAKLSLCHLGPVMRQLVTDNNVNKVFDEMLMFVRVLRLVYIPCTTSSGLALTEVRGIANSKDSVLMQGLIHGRRSVRGHPKVRSELSVMRHQNFLFDMEMIRP
ncbi:hypothetical protein B296_00018087 [Ensete ventricosum]|uniref:Uncharacterized protein n=1 Tax=Ensete ventricosum TaxID=4639 RepID=A0A427A2B2_ENSVE|nr:hypothetical protein B296_00018087 [Ensete ventricosum]